MKFNEMHYERPDMQQVEEKFSELLHQFNSAKSADEQKRVMEDINSLRSHFMTMSTLASIRNSIDTRDAFYRDEKAYFDEVTPTFEHLETLFRGAITSSQYRKELEAAFGAHLFRLADLAVQFFSPEIIEDMKQNNQLVTEYNALVASAKIPFDGKELTLSQLGKYVNVPDRSVRKAANEARYEFFAAHEAQFDDIYDRMVKLRTQMARKLGYDNFVKMGYARMNRTDYGPTEAAAFRKQVKDLIVPLAEKLRERQRERIGVDTLHYYDTALNFPSGNPEPKGDADWIVENGRKMYHELSPETDEFFAFMADNDLLDLLSKEGKRVGGYCDIIPEEKAPFIFANFNGTAHDVTVLTHEAGHAFQAYSSRNYPVPEYLFPTSEAAEIHSMSMEFFTWDWMNLFFNEDTEKFKFYHLSDSVTTIPYLVSVDEFQHFVYENPDATPAERKAAWRDIERKYLPHRNYAENEYLERGGYWHQQLHIFNYPFYYIDYALAQICALQFWKKMHDNREAAWKDYLHLCKLGGTMSFVDLVREANLISPFEDGCVKSVIGEIEKWLDSVDDKAL
ncbi:M3 family oligoendopeptidase [Alicyclobacillus dauci]|uniref:M3 family oligoendopeptidase n=1 Tax=Alicyclobacillus dauci TaxID=1475485 RepID=A0ABY6Z6C4_9BACL|nr:M3 family oligoendopeptidase [Alicyclobacillus dauci]WAH37736.1 M3 family oligoendopeptidase [Alicyclobacillus dauci]